MLSAPVELGLERRTDWGHIRFYASVKSTLTSFAAHCGPGDTVQICEGAPGSPLYAGLSIGFDLRSRSARDRARHARPLTVA